MQRDDDIARRKKLGRLVEEPQRLSKLRGASAGAFDTPSGDQTCTAIVKVGQDDYVPAGITPVSRISPTIFTARLRAADIERLDSDPLVASVELSRRVQPTKT
ncbi:MAG: hypothetical protein QNJ94_02950 [Alphaproteobacteria bacterium]|nr:hypothetical protein [Alphaproteobacteria bacterium]